MRDDRGRGERTPVESSKLKVGSIIRGQKSMVREGGTISASSSLRLYQTIAEGVRRSAD